jgi:hypothetical protein
MVDLYKDIDFSDILAKEGRLQQFLAAAAREVAKDVPDDPAYKKPGLQTDFNNYIVCTKRFNSL